MDWFSEHWLVLVVVGGIAATPHLLLPVVVYFIFRYPDPELRPAPADDAGVPVEVAAYWEEVRRTLEPLGFREVQRVIADAKQQHSYMCLFQEGDGATVAAATITWARAGKAPPLISRNVQFALEYQDEATVSCLIDDAGLVFPSAPHRVVLWFPREQDLGRLWQCQVEAQRLYGRGRTKPPPATEQEWLAELNGESTKTIDRLVQTGWLRRKRGGSVRLTLWSAYIVSWKVLWPWRNIRRRLLGEREREVLRAVMMRTGGAAAAAS